MLKSIIPVLLVCATLLTGCKYNDNHSALAVETEKAVIDAAPLPALMNEISEACNSDTPTSEEPNLEELNSEEHTIDETNTVPTLTNEYSEACAAYREFLLGQRSALVYQSWQELYYEYYTYGAVNSEFTLVDINHDGIPELHFRSRAYDIYSYCDGQVFRVGGYQQNAELLNNLAIYTDYWERNRITEATRNYIEFGEDLKPCFSLYFSYDAVSGIYSLKYNGMDTTTHVTQQEFETITGPILSYCTDKKNYDMISWTNFGEWLEQNIDEYVRVENTHG